MGPLTITVKENTSILVISDNFIRFREELLLQNGSAETMAELLKERVFSYLRMPERIHKDQGMQFECRLIAELCTFLKRRKILTTSYHP